MSDNLHRNWGILPPVYEPPYIAHPKPRRGWFWVFLIIGAMASGFFFAASMLPDIADWILS